ncbi:MAG: PF20097 family protein [Anaerotignaceae bacterium]
MKCPYCNAEMKKGVIQSPYDLNWLPKKSLIGNADFHQDSIKLSKGSPLSGGVVEAYVCSECRKIVINY